MPPPARPPISHRLRRPALAQSRDHAALSLREDRERGEYATALLDLPLLSTGSQPLPPSPMTRPRWLCPTVAHGSGRACPAASPGVKQAGRIRARCGWDHPLVTAPNPRPRFAVSSMMQQVKPRWSEEAR